MYRAQRFEDARAAFDKLVAQPRPPGGAYLGLAKVAFQEGKYEEAAKWSRLGARASTGPVAVDAWLLLGDASYRLNQHKEAQSRLQRGGQTRSDERDRPSNARARRTQIALVSGTRVSRQRPTRVENRFESAAIRAGTGPRVATTILLRGMLMTGRFPRQFGKYVLLKPLAKGGMGEIYLAAGGEVGGFEKLCVIKKVITEKADRTKANRFLDEAKVVLRLCHSALVNTFDAGEVNGEFYIAMELVEGKDLREVWNRCVRTRQRIPLDVALHVVREVARALAYVHGYGDLRLVHRDVAPPNILLAYVGDVKLTDFGLARSVLKQEHTAPGVVFGRAAYLSPEQARGEMADARTDVYTLGIVLWELLTGQQFLQLSGLDPAAALALVRHPRLVAPSVRAPWITPVLDQVALKALAPERDKRFQSAEELRQALTTVIAEIAPTADSSRVSDFLHSIYADTISEERGERERFLKSEIPNFRSALARGVRFDEPKPEQAQAKERPREIRDARAADDDAGGSRPMRPPDPPTTACPNDRAGPAVPARPGCRACPTRTCPREIRPRRRRF